MTMLWARQSAVCFLYFYLVFTEARHASDCYSDKNWCRNWGSMSCPCLCPDKVELGGCTQGDSSDLYYVLLSLFTYERPPWHKATSTGLGEAKGLQQLPASSAACCQHRFLTSTVFSDARLKLKTSHGETIPTTETATNHRFALHPPSQLLNVSGYTAASPLWKHYFRWLSLGAAFGPRGHGGWGRAGRNSWNSFKLAQV